ncbi:MAG: hypothetical protein IH991_22945, partial [Planctomycetes bacterium]|nr:hypothetical protein [Planctomycetota bacterium]
EGESFACGELSDTVRDDHFTGVSEVTDPTGLCDDNAVDVSVFLDGFACCHTDT